MNIQRVFTRAELEELLSQSITPPRFDECDFSSAGCWWLEAAKK